MRIRNAPRNLEELAEKLSIEYSDFFGVPESIFDIDIELRQKEFPPRAIISGDNRHAIIDIGSNLDRLTYTNELFQSNYIKKRFSRDEIEEAYKLWNKRLKVENTFTHEYKHIILFLTRWDVIKKNPEEYKEYIIDRTCTEYAEKLNLEKSSLLREGLEMIFNTNIIQPQGLELFYYKEHGSRDLYLDESFADDSNLDDVLTRFTNVQRDLKNKAQKIKRYFFNGLAIGCGAAAAFAFKEDHILPGILGVISGTAAYLKSRGIKRKGYCSPMEILDKDRCFSNEVLSSFSKEDRKYIVSMPPPKSVSFRDHLEKLQQYGFPIKAKPY